MIQKSPCEALGISNKCNLVSGIYLSVLVRQQGMLFDFYLAIDNDDTRL